MCLKSHYIHYVGKTSNDQKQTFRLKHDKLLSTSFALCINHFWWARFSYLGCSRDHCNVQRSLFNFVINRIFLRGGRMVARGIIQTFLHCWVISFRTQRMSRVKPKICTKNMTTRCMKSQYIMMEKRTNDEKQKIRLKHDKLLSTSFTHCINLFWRVWFGYLGCSRDHCNVQRSLFNFVINRIFIRGGRMVARGIIQTFLHCWVISFRTQRMSRVKPKICTKNMTTRCMKSQYIMMMEKRTNDEKQKIRLKHDKLLSTSFTHCINLFWRVWFGYLGCSRDHCNVQRSLFNFVINRIFLRGGRMVARGIIQTFLHCPLLSLFTSSNILFKSLLPIQQ